MLFSDNNQPEVDLLPSLGAQIEHSDAFYTTLRDDSETKIAWLNKQIITCQAMLRNLKKHFH